MKANQRFAQGCNPASANGKKSVKCQSADGKQAKIINIWRWRVEGKTNGLAARQPDRAF